MMKRTKNAATVGGRGWSWTRFRVTAWRYLGESSSSVVLILVALVVALVVFLFGPGVTVSVSGPTHFAVGKSIPDLDLVRVSDSVSPQTAGAIPRGDVVLLHFWATWCPPCRQEFPELFRMVERQSDPRFRFIPVTCGGRGDTLSDLRESTQSFFESVGIQSPIYADPRGFTRRSAAERLGQPGLYLPTSILIGGDGRIRGVWIGYATGSVAEIEATVRQSLSQARPPESPDSKDLSGHKCRLPFAGRALGLLRTKGTRRLIPAHC